jgi:hypothetical protein
MKGSTGRNPGTRSAGPGEIGAILGCSDRHARRLMVDGYIRSIIISERGDRRVPPDEVERLRALVAAGGSVIELHADLAGDA